MRRVAALLGAVLCLHKSAVADLRGFQEHRQKTRPVGGSLSVTTASFDSSLNSTHRRWPCSHQPLPPTRCPQGNDRFTMAELKAALAEFAMMYAKRPVASNMGGVNVNHAFSLWYIAKALKPPVVVESGIWRGQGTWLLRQAVGPDVPIICLDPHDPTERGTPYWKDASGKTTYLTGINFVDFSQAAWQNLVPDPASRALAFVALDDHMASTKRVKQALGFGFRRLWYDDNWRDADCYSFNMVCAPPTSANGTVPYKDNFGKTSVMLSPAQHDANVQYLASRLATYFEFPPILDACPGTRPTILGSEADLATFGLPPKASDVYGYQSLRPPLVELLPTAVP